jgi:glutathione synthase/RimK-type ligase-like ATP-grasp enzyme
MIWCALKYGAGYTDYRNFNFAKIRGKCRKTFITRSINNEFIRKLNNREDYEKFENKVKFNELFKDYLGREWLFLKDATPEEFAEFIKNKNAVIVKPIDALCGHGVEKTAISEETNADSLYKELIEKNQLLVEDYIVQHSEISRIYSGAVNTVRMVTIKNSDDEVHVVFRGLRMGCGSSVVDNFHFGGMITILNENGEILTDATNEKNEVFSAHPDSGVVFKGTKIPLIKEAEKMAKEAACLVPGIRYVGWDIAITEERPVFIEANHNPAYDFFQTRAYMQDHESGLLPLFASVIK